jgi:hypothetical protein
VGQAGVDGGEVLAELDEQRFRFGIDVLIAGLEAVDRRSRWAR